jgi:hypothetical protein
MLAIGVPSNGGGLGLSIAGQVFVVPLLALRIGGSFRQGVPIDAARANGDAPDRFDSTTWTAGGGLAFYPLRSTRTQRFGVAVRVDAFGEHQQLTLEGSPPSSRGQWFPALDAMADASFLFLDDVEIVAGGGAEYAPRDESILRSGQPAFPLPHILGVGEAGIRIRF